MAKLKWRLFLGRCRKYLNSCLNRQEFFTRKKYKQNLPETEIWGRVLGKAGFLKGETERRCF